MKDKEEQRKSAARLNLDEGERFKLLISELEWFLDNKDIKEEGYHRLNNIFVEVASIKEIYVARMINMLKQDQMID